MSEVQLFLSDFENIIQVQGPKYCGRELLQGTLLQFSGHERTGLLKEARLFVLLFFENFQDAERLDTQFF